MDAARLLHEARLHQVLAAQQADEVAVAFEMAVHEIEQLQKALERIEMHDVERQFLAAQRGQCVLQPGARDRSPVAIVTASDARDSRSTYAAGTLRASSRRRQVSGLFASDVICPLGSDQDVEAVQRALGIDESDALFTIGACSAFVSDLMNKTRSATLSN